MRAFACPTCGRLVTFESLTCLNCGTALAFDPTGADMVALDADRRRCANEPIAGCNWLATTEGGLCASCVLTRTRPADDDVKGLLALTAAEAAKRRLLFELAELSLPICSWREQEGGLAFDLLSSHEEKVMTGHADGVITLDLSETDHGRRERRRIEFDEPYRTVLGHLRHEIGHYYQPLLTPDGSAAQNDCRALFGDDTLGYQEALDRHYEAGAPADWAENYVSAYATMHPWEDWAETWAHYLHIRDTLQTAAAHGLRVHGPNIQTTDEAPLHAVPVEDGDMHTLLGAWLPLTYALNAINRSMGANDLYPFVISPAVEAKLQLVHRLVRSGVSEQPQQPSCDDGVTPAPVAQAPANPSAAS